MKKLKGIASIILILLLAIVVGCQASPVAESVQDNTSVQKSSYTPKRDILVVGLKGDIFGFHPNISNYESTTFSVNFNIFDALVELDQKNIIQPALATSWENVDDLTWRFHLRKGVKFHSGHDFTAQDVKYSFDLILNKDDSVLRDLLAEVQQVDVVDDYTVDIKTSEPSPLILNRFIDAYIVSEEYETSATDRIPNGTGAYTFKEYREGDFIELELNSSYWKETKGLIKTVRYKIIGDDQERINALLAKKIDFAELLPPEKLDELKAQPDINVPLIASTRVIFLVPDFRVNDSYAFPGRINPISDIRVRKAMYHAINEDKILSDVMNGLGEPATQPIAPTIFGYNPDIKRLPYDVVKARELMEEAGYEEGFPLEMDCPNDRYIKDAEICLEIARQLQSINIRVKLNIQTKSDFFDKIDAYDTSLHLIGWATDTPFEIFNYVLHSIDKEKNLGLYNLNFYSNPLVDEISERAATIIDPEERLKVIREGFKIAMDDVAIIPLHMQKTVYGLVPDVFWQPRADERLKLEEMRIE